MAEGYWSGDCSGKPSSCGTEGSPKIGGWESFAPRRFPRWFPQMTNFPPGEGAAPDDCGDNWNRGGEAEEVVCGSLP